MADIDINRPGTTIQSSPDRGGAPSYFESLGDEIERQKAEFESSYGFVSPLTPEQYNLSLRILSESKNPDQDMYRINAAASLSKIYNVPFSTAYGNVESMTKALLGREYKPDATTAGSIQNSWTLGLLARERRALAKDFMDITMNGGDATYISERMQTLDQQIAGLQDDLPRFILTDILKLTTESLVYNAEFTGAMVLGGIAAGPVLGALTNYLGIGGAMGTGFMAKAASKVPALISFGFTNAMMGPGFQGEQFYDLVQDGADPDVAYGVTKVSSGLQVAIESLIGIPGSFLGKGFSATKFVNRFMGKLWANGKLGGKLLQFGSATLLDAAGEGVEEVLGLGTEDITNAVAYALSDMEVPEENWSSLSDYVEAFLGGMGGTIILAGAGAAMNLRIDSEKATILRDLAQSGMSEEQFRTTAKALNLVPEKYEMVYDQKTGSSEMETSEATEQETNDFYHEVYEMNADKRDTSVFNREGVRTRVQETDKNPEDVNQETAEPTPSIDDEPVRLPSGIYRMNAEDGAGEHVPSGGTRLTTTVTDPSGKLTYADITYIRKGNNIDIQSIDITEGEHLQTDGFRDDILRQFASMYPDYNVTFSNPRFSAESDSLSRVIASNPRGQQYGLNFGLDFSEEDRAGVRERIKLFNFSEEQKSAAVRLIQMLGAAEGKTGVEFFDSRFQSTITEEEFARLFPEEYAKAQAKGGMNAAYIPSSRVPDSLRSASDMGNSVRGILVAGRNANPTSFEHEVIHALMQDKEKQDSFSDLFSKEMNGKKAFWDFVHKSDLYKDSNVKENFDYIETHPELFQKGAQWGARQHEFVARLEEMYRLSGQSTRPELRGFFQRLTDFFRRIYGALKQEGVLSDEIVAYFDSFFGTPEDLQRNSGDSILMQENTLNDVVYASTNAEAKEILKTHIGENIVNSSDGTIARYGTNGLNKLISNAAKSKSVANGFTAAEHLTAVANTPLLFRESRLLLERPDNEGHPDLIIRYYGANVAFDGNGKHGIAQILVKINTNHPNTIYTMELVGLTKESRPIDGSIDSDGFRRPDHIASKGGRPENRPFHADDSISILPSTSSSGNKDKLPVDTLQDTSLQDADASMREASQGASAIILPSSPRSGNASIDAILRQEPISAAEFDEFRRRLLSDPDNFDADGNPLAPNSERSNLTLEQWITVRTPEFKEWFGDWELDPENASKVVDENGEPRVMYHGSDADFSEFDRTFAGNTANSAKIGFWFTTDEGFAERFAQEILFTAEPIIYSVFLNMRKPQVYNATPSGTFSLFKEYERRIREADSRINEAERNGIPDEEIRALIDERDSLQREVESYTGMDAYDVFKSDIEKAGGNDRYIQRLREDGYDGVLIRQTLYDSDIAEGQANDQYVVLDPNQIKSATRNNGQFDAENPDIYFQLSDDMRASYKKIAFADAIDEITAHPQDHTIAGEKFQHGKPASSKASKALFRSIAPRGVFTNRETNIKADFGRTYIDEISGHDWSNEAHLASIMAVPRIYENALHVGKFKDGENRLFDYFLSIFDYDGTSYLVRSAVREGRGNEFYYDHKLSELSKIKDWASSGFRLSTPGLDSSNPSIIEDTRLQRFLQGDLSDKTELVSSPFIARQPDSGIFFQNAIENLSTAVTEIENGAESAVIHNARTDLLRYGGSNDVELIWGDEKKGLYHIGYRRGADVVANVLLTIIRGDILRHTPAKRTVNIGWNGYQAVLSLDMNGTDRTWLLTGWKDNAPDAISEVSTQSDATHDRPTFSRSDMGAGLRNILTAERTSGNPDIYFQQQADAKAKKDWLLSASDEEILREIGRGREFVFNTDIEEALTDIRSIVSVSKDYDEFVGFMEAVRDGSSLDAATRRRLRRALRKRLAGERAEVTVPPEAILNDTGDYIDTYQMLRTEQESSEDLSAPVSNDIPGVLGADERENAITGDGDENGEIEDTALRRAMETGEEKRENGETERVIRESDETIRRIDEEQTELESQLAEAEDELSAEDRKTARQEAVIENLIRQSDAKDAVRGFPEGHGDDPARIINRREYIRMWKEFLRQKDRDYIKFWTDYVKTLEKEERDAIKAGRKRSEEEYVQWWDEIIRRQDEKYYRNAAREAKRVREAYISWWKKKLDQEAARTSRREAVETTKAKYKAIIKKMEENQRAKDKARRERQQAQRIKRYKESLVARIMRKVSANTELSFAEKIYAIQALMTEDDRQNLIIGGERWSVELLREMFRDTPNDPMFSALRPGMLDILTKKRPSDFTVEELENLLDAVNELRRDGLRAWQAVVDARAAEDRAIVRAMLGVVRKHRRYYEQPIKDDERNEKGFRAFARDAYYNVINMPRLAQILDNGDPNGPFHQFLVRRNREYEDAQARAIAMRLSVLTTALKEQGIRPSDLFKNVQISVDGEVLNTTLSELVYIHYALNNAKNYQAFAYGVLVTKNEKDNILREMDKEVPGNPRDKLKRSDGSEKSRTVGEERMARTNDRIRALGDKRFQEAKAQADAILAENPKVMAAAEAVLGDLNGNGFERVQRIMREQFNREISKEDFYMPIRHMDWNETPQQNETYEAMKARQLAESTLMGVPQYTASVRRGFTEEREEISPYNQTPINYDFFQIWQTSVRDEEHLVAAMAYTRSLRRVFGNAQLKGAITRTYGKEMMGLIDSFINEVAQPWQHKEINAIEKSMRFLRGGLYTSYLGFRASNIIMQAVTSPLPFLSAGVTPAAYMRQLFRLMSDYDATWQMISELSPMMDQRSFDLLPSLLAEERAAIRQQEGSETQQAIRRNLDRLQEMSLWGLDRVDRIAVGAGWLAIYEREMQRNGGVSEEAARVADDVVLATQPVQRRSEMSRLFKTDNEALKFFTQFTASLNVVFQNIFFDIPMAYRNRQWGKFWGTIGAYVLSGALLFLIREEPWEDSDDDGEEEFQWRRFIYSFFSQAVDSVPLISDSVSQMIYEPITGENAFTFFGSEFPPLERLARVPGNITDKDWQKAIMNSIESIGLFSGIPTLAFQDFWDAIESISQGEAPESLWR